MHVTHTFEPVYNGESRVLVLGTFPSVKSRESAFIMGIPRTVLESDSGYCKGKSAGFHRREKEHAVKARHCHMGCDFLLRYQRFQRQFYKKRSAQ